MKHLLSLTKKKFVIVDVGGQRSERSKWLHAFHSVNCIVFLCAIDEYDGKVLAEDNVSDRLLESMNLFKKLTNSEWLINIPFVLFLNKTDLFKEKIYSKPLSTMLNRFPSYEEDLKTMEKTKGLDEYQIGINYFEINFHKLHGGNQNLYVHETCQSIEATVKHYSTLYMKS